MAIKVNSGGLFELKSYGKHRGEMTRRDDEDVSEQVSPTGCQVTNMPSIHLLPSKTVLSTYCQNNLLSLSVFLLLMEHCPVYPDPEKLPSPMVRSASDVVLNSDPFNTTTDRLKNSSESSDKMIEDEKDYSIYSKCAAEFIAVMLFVYVGSMQATGVMMHDGVLHAAFAHGVAIFVLAATFAGVSGAHVNPAVTFGIALVGRLNPIHAVCYVVSQLMGSVLGALLVRISLSYKSYSAIAAGATLCGKGIAWQEGLTAEIVTTYILVQTVLLCAVDTEKNKLAPLAIGFSLIIDILAAGAISGASMNPARSFGPNIMGQLFLRSEHLDIQYMFWNYHWIYYIGPVIGAFLAAGVYRMFFARDYRVLA